MTASRSALLAELSSIVTDESPDPLTDGARTGRHVVLHGAVGVGKSRLAADLLDAADRAGRRTAFLRCTAASQDHPLATFSPLIPLGSTDSDGVHVMLRARRAVVEFGGERPAVLVVDDLHLIDDASATLLTQLVEAGEAQLIGTYRSGEFVPEPIGGLWHRAPITRVEVPDMDPADAVRMAEQLAGGPLDQVSVDRVLALTGGNPLHLSVLVRACRDAGTLVVGPDGRRSIGDFRSAATLVDFVEAEVGRLDAPQRAALGVIALGEPLGIPEVESLTGLGVVAELEELGYVELSVDGRRSCVRVTHPLFAEIIRARLSRLRVRLVYRDLVDLTEKYGFRRREDLVRAAHWALEGGVPLSPDVGVAAARAAWFAHQYAVAEGLARTSWERDRSFEAGQILSSVAYETGHGPEVDQICSELMARSTSSAELVAATAGRALNRFWRLADLDGALALLDETAPLADEDDRTELDATRATMLAFAGRADEALGLAGPVLAGPFGRAKMHGLLSACVAMRHLGRAREAVGIIDQVTADLVVIPQWLNLIESTVLRTARITALAELGRFADVEREGLQLRAHCQVIGDHGMGALVDLALGVAISGQGRHQQALAHLEDAARALREASHDGQRRWALSMSAVVAGEAGLTDRCRSLLSELDGLAHHPASLWSAQEWRGRAWLARLELRPDDARELMGRAADTAVALGDRPGFFGCVHDLARFGDPRGALRRLEAGGWDADGPLVAAYRLRIRALAARDPVGLADASRAFESMDALHHGAEAAAESGETAAQRGDQRRAATQRMRAEALLAKCERPAGAATPLAAPTQLTRREHEVATLAAHGLATRDIAERLYLSPRTVENHLARAYIKLDVRTRVQLAEVFGVEGRPGGR